MNDESKDERIDPVLRNFETWVAGRTLSKNIWALTRNLSYYDKDTVGRQLRNSSSSVPANLAEGKLSRSIGRFRYHTRIARGSLAETETHLLHLEEERPDLDTAEVWQQIASLRRKVNALLRWLENQP